MVWAVAVNGLEHLDAAAGFPAVERLGARVRVKVDETRHHQEAASVAASLITRLELIRQPIENLRASRSYSATHSSIAVNTWRTYRL